MRLWSTISPADRHTHEDLSKELEKDLAQAKQFHALLALMREIDPDTPLPAPGQFFNGGIESDLEFTGANTFDWMIEARASAQVSADSNAHSGQKSLRIVLRAPRNLDKIPVSQTVVVEPGSQYRFECYARTEDLISASTPALFILDAVDGAVLATS